MRWTVRLRCNKTGRNRREYRMHQVFGDFEIIGVQCYIKNDDQKAKIASMSKGDTVTLKGKCTDVGEVLGYSLDIDEIE